MVTKKIIVKDALLAELGLHKEEFSALRQEILQLMDSERQYLNLSLVAFGAIIGLAPFISTQKTYIVLLIFPLVFHVLLSEMLKSMRSVGLIASYLMTTLIPRVNEILDLLGRERQDITTLGWETHTHEKWATPREFIASSLTPSRHWIPILAIGGLIITYALVVQNAGYTPSKGEMWLILLNLVLLIWAAIQNVLITRTARIKANRND
jgi:hypothetical protein